MRLLYVRRGGVSTGAVGILSAYGGEHLVA